MRPALRPPTRVLVTGAAGMIGRAVLDVLAAQSVAATALVFDRPATALRADRVIAGDARDVEKVREALVDADAVIHLAAIPSPTRDHMERVFGLNTLSTFVVLDYAGQAGVTRAAIASSYAICGLPFAGKPLTMPYLPVDRNLPLQITDGYALSKLADEHTAAMVNRRYGTNVVALRLPYVGTSAQRLPETAARYAENPASGAAEVWSYLDVRDAARALVAGLSPAEPGAHVVYVAAPETLAPYPTDELLDRFHPGVPRPSFPGRTVPIDLRPARELLGFEATFPFQVEQR